MSLRSVLGGIVKVGVGLATGGVGGAISSAIGGAGRPNFGPQLSIPFPVKGPGGVALPGFGSPAQTTCPRGYHLNKKPLAACKKHGAVAARTICVRNRSMNPMNYRALTKSLKRIKRAQKIVRKLHKFGTPQRRLPAGRPVAISENLRITSGGK